jgi:hypothetical protein
MGELVPAYSQALPLKLAQVAVPSQREGGTTCPNILEFSHGAFDGPPGINEFGTHTVNMSVPLSSSCSEFGECTKIKIN